MNIHLYRALQCTKEKKERKKTYVYIHTLQQILHNSFNALEIEYICQKLGLEEGLMFSSISKCPVANT